MIYSSIQVNQSIKKAEKKELMGNLFDFENN